MPSAPSQPLPQPKTAQRVWDSPKIHSSVEVGVGVPLRPLPLAQSFVIGRRQGHTSAPSPSQAGTATHVTPSLAP